MATTQFYVYTDDQASSNEIAEQIIERFKSDYPEATSETNFDEDEELFSSVEEEGYYPPITFVVREKKHPYLQHNIETGDLFWKCKLTTRQAERGAKLKLPLPDGSQLEIESKSGTKSGEQMRVSGRGMLLKAAASGGKGDDGQKKTKTKKGDVIIEFVVER